MFHDGSILIFDITSISPGAVAQAILPSKLSVLPIFTLTVASSQKNGKYELAENATDFNSIITVQNTSNQSLGTLSVGKPLMIDGASYKLDLSTSNILTVTISGNTPPTSPPGERLFFTGDFNGNGKALPAVKEENRINIYRNKGILWS